MVKRESACSARELGLVPASRAHSWLLYLAACVLAFEHGNLTVHQVLAVRQGDHGASGLPRTRSQRLTTTPCGPGERDRAHVVVPRQRGAHLRATRHELHGTGRAACCDERLADHAHQLQGGQRVCGAGLATIGQPAARAGPILWAASSKR